jgi:SAM-dependent methyltransferase
MRRCGHERAAFRPCGRLCAGALRRRDAAADRPAPAVWPLHPAVPHRRGCDLGGEGAGRRQRRRGRRAAGGRAGRAQGRVVGVDTNGEILEVARTRAEAAGWTNVAFRAGDVMALELDSGFDAVVGRWVLQYTPDPAALLRRARRWLRPGGIVAFQEIDLSIPPRAWPAGRCTSRSWAGPRRRRALPDPIPRWGSKLFSTFLRAGLPAPQLRRDVPMGGGAGWPGYGYVADTVRSRPCGPRPRRAIPVPAPGPVHDHHLPGWRHLLGGLLLASSRSRPYGECDPSCPDVCLDPDAADYDRAGGSGNGPEYVDGPIRVRPRTRSTLTGRATAGGASRAERRPPGQNGVRAAA